MPSEFNFADWPPVLSDPQIQALTLYASTYALSHGLLYLPPAILQPPTPSSAIHAPLSLFPSPVPKSLFELAKRLQKSYNILYSRIAMDWEFLDHVMGEEEGVGRVDQFVGQLWRQWKQLRDEGPLAQSLHLGLFRSDYLLHSPPSHSQEAPSLKQVEFNTISSSFGSLSERTAALHRHLYSLTRYYDCSPAFTEESFPPNSTTSGLAAGLAAAHNTYNAPNAYILFVVQAGERNVFDQRWLEYELLERHSIHIIRQTFDELHTSASLRSSDQSLQVLLSPDLLATASAVEISVVYFRAGYTPNDYPTQSQYEIRLLLERSRAIKCPSIPLQLAGGKKIQQVLTKSGVLERFLCDKNRWGGDNFTPQELEEIRASWMGMWGLDDTNGHPDRDLGTPSDTENERWGTHKARVLASSIVLKPQREGGGNNIYKSDIPAFLDRLPPKERAAWIAMELIIPPDTGNYLLRAGGSTDGAIRTDVVSELGIFGWALFDTDTTKVSEQEAGWLMRTKGKESNEGGVAAGFSVLDSIVLVDG